MGIADVFFEHVEGCLVCNSEEDVWCDYGRALLDEFVKEVTGEGEPN